MSAGEWWREGVIYQVYPRSFQDSNGDGIGDLRGVIDRLDYLRWLGVDAIWLNPITVSPDADVGYDVADYCGVQPVFGDLGAVDRLIAEAAKREIKIVLDIVPNHSSDRHRGSSTRGPLARPPTAIGTSGPIPSRTAARQITG